MRLNVQFEFCAAHRLPNYDGPCNRVHGHNYRFVVTIAGEPDEHSGMIMDFVEIERIVKELVVDKIDHRDLNDFLENPTAEFIVKWFWELLEPPLEGLQQIELWEMEGLSVSYRGPGGP